ncbi:MAG TPA: hypothetical protein PLW07_08045, partial [bacterium]|nr:hypothetical protein [bacterium]
MKKDFIRKWRSLDRNGRRNLVRQFIAAKQTSSELPVEKKHDSVLNDSTIKKHTFRKITSFMKLKPIFAFGFASSGSSGES